MIMQANSKVNICVNAFYLIMLQINVKEKLDMTFDDMGSLLFINIPSKAVPAKSVFVGRSFA